MSRNKPRRRWSHPDRSLSGKIKREQSYQGVPVIIDQYPAVTVEGVAHRSVVAVLFVIGAVAIVASALVLMWT